MCADDVDFALRRRSPALLFDLESMARTRSELVLFLLSVLASRCKMHFVHAVKKM